MSALPGLLLAAAFVQGQATGRFEVDARPTAGPDPTIAALTLHKTFHGQLDGTSVGEMLASGEPASGTASYVAIERVVGTLDGRRGSFAFLHHGAMGPGGMRLDVTVVPGSGTGALTGLAGTMAIDVAAGHTYVFRYTLPGG